MEGVSQLSTHVALDRYPEIVERNRFVAERQESAGDEVVVFSDEKWSDSSDGQELRPRFEYALELLGIKDVTHDRLVAGGYSSPLGGGRREIDLPPFNGELPTLQILSAMADWNAGGWADDPNDFDFRLEISRDDGLVAIVRYESEQSALLCEECRSRQEDAEHSEYSCEHFNGQYDYRTKYSVTLAKPDPALKPHQRVCFGL